MLGTVISLIIALFIYFHSFAEGQPQINGNIIGIILAAGAALFLSLLTLSFAFAWSPLQKAEQNMTPRLLDMLKKDYHIQIVSGWLVIFFIASFALAIDVSSLHMIKEIFLICLWIVMLGLSVDALIHLLKRINSYLNPYMTVQIFTHAANTSIQNEKEMDLCEWIDSLCEIAFKAAHRSSPSLTNHTLNELQLIIRNFLEASKSISHHEQDSQTKLLGITDKVSFTLFYLFQRLELIFDKGLELNLEPICSNIITILGKISIYAAKYDLSMTSYPLHFLGKLANKAMRKSLQEVGIKASITLMEVAKVLLTEVDITYGELKDPFFSIIMHLEDIAKETFRQDKSINISLLTAPFKELRELFKIDKAAAHQDAPVILQDIGRVLGEFEALELVLKTIPPLEVPPEAEAASTQPTEPPQEPPQSDAPAPETLGT